MNRALLIFAILAGLLIAFAYYKGSTQVATTTGTQLNNLALTAQGRTASGQFANYPGGSPNTGSGG